MNADAARKSVGAARLFPSRIKAGLLHGIRLNFAVFAFVLLLGVVRRPNARNGIPR